MITVDQINDAFRTAVIGTAPRMLEGRTSWPWRYNDTGDQKQPVRSDARWFWFEWDGEGDTPDGFMGPLQVDTTVTLSMFVDYGGIPERRVKLVAVDDHKQIRDVLNRLKSANTGLLMVTLGDWAFASNNTDRNQARIVLQFAVRYMKARG